MQKQFIITGYKTIEFRKSGVIGEAPSDVTSEELRSETLKLNITGHVNDITANIDIQQSSQASGTDTKQQIQIDHPHFSLLLGEFQADFVKANLLTYQDQMDGIKGNIKFEKYQAGFILSKLKGVRRKELQKGNNSQGPYGVLLTPILANSETIQLDGKIQERDQDYRIDYTAGQITFLKAIITPYQEITIVYESSNTQYSDRVTGYSYQFSGILNSLSNVYFLQKRQQNTDTSQVGAAQTEILLFTQDYDDQSLFFNGEFAFSKYIENIATMDQYSIGPAFYLKLGQRTEQYQVYGYASKISSVFVPFNTYQIHSGDATWGLYASYSEDLLALLGQYDHRNIHENDIPVEDKEALLSGRYVLAKIPFNLSYKQRSYQSWVDPQTQGTSYLKTSVDGASQLDLWIGKLVANTGVELYDDHLIYGNSYRQGAVQTGYSVSPFQNFDFAFDTAFKHMWKFNGDIESEKRAKVSSKLQGESLYSLSSSYEWIRISSKPDITIFNVQSFVKPFKEVELDADMTNERLLETYNKSSVDVEKIDASFKLKLEPFRNIRLDLGFKPKLKRQKPDDLVLSSQEGYNSNLSFPVLKMGQMTYLFKRQNDYVIQTKYYPEALLKDSIYQQDTHILRWRFMAIEDINTQLQYEKSKSHKENLIATNNAFYQTADQDQEIKKVELSKQFDQLTLGLAYENTIVNDYSVTENNLLKHKWTGSVKYPLSEDFTILSKFNFLQTQTDRENFYSLNPEMSLIYSFTNIFQLNLGYSYLEEHKQAQVERTHQITTAMKAEFVKNFILELDGTYEVHPELGYSLFDCVAKGSVFF